jgi:hypothetical protein
LTSGVVTMAACVDGGLGGQAFNMRAAVPGPGKRGGARTLVALRQDHHVFYGLRLREESTC